MASLLLIPTELIVEIFQGCNSLGQLQSLIMTSKRFHAVWQAHASAIIWNVAPKEIPAFDTALIAVRATNLVYEEWGKGLIPPQIRPRELSGQRGRPSPKELKEVRDLHRFVRWAELVYVHETQFGGVDRLGQAGVWMFYRGGNPKAAVNASCPDNFFDDGAQYHGEYHDAWRERFDAAAYMTFVLGAVLARPYNEFFFPRTSSSAMRGPAYPTSETRLHIQERNSADILKDWFWIQLFRSEVEYMLEFPVFHLEVDLEKQHEIFGDLADWFAEHVIESSRTRRPFVPVEPWASSHYKFKLFHAPSTSWPETAAQSESFTRGSASQGGVVFGAAVQTMHMIDFLSSWHRDRKWSHVSPRTWEPKVVTYGLFWPDGEVVPNALKALRRSNHYNKYLATSAGIYDATWLPPHNLTFFAFFLARDFRLRLISQYANDNLLDATRILSCVPM